MTHSIYLLSVTIHILSAMVWIGGMLFLVLVVVPWLRSGAAVDASRFLRETGVRFRNVGWACFGLLLATGTYNLYVRGVRFASFTDDRWLASSYGKVIVLKLTAFAIVLAVSAAHDFYVGPRATDAIARSPASEETTRLRARASKLGRLNAVMGLVLVVLAVLIVRGVP